MYLFAFIVNDACYHRLKDTNVVDDCFVGKIRSSHFDHELLGNFILDVDQGRLANDLVEPVHGGFITSQFGRLDSLTLPSADNSSGSHLVQPPLCLLLEGGGGRGDFLEGLGAVNLRLAYVIS